MIVASEVKHSGDKTSKKSVLRGCSCGLLGLLSALFLPLLLYLTLVGIGGLLIVSDPIERVDAVVVLSGGDGDRLALAIEMHKDGFAPNLVITDTTSGMNNRLVREAMQGGFKRESIFVTDLQVDSTYDEALAVREFSLLKNWDKFMVVTDPYHSFRTRFIFQRELKNSGIEILVRPVVGHWFTSSTWFFRLEGWQFVILEFGKLMNYLFLTS